MQIHRTDVTEGFEWKRENGEWKKYYAEFIIPRPRPFMFTCSHFPLMHDWTYDLEETCAFCVLDPLNELVF